MGWTFTNKPKGESVKEFFSKEFNYENETSVGRVIDCSASLREAYLAYEIEKKNNGGQKEVVAIVCLIQYTKDPYYNFGYKDMDETMWPYYYNCPERILKLLTPTTNENALEWRKRCWENIERKKARPKFEVGDILEFEEPIEFSGGIKMKQLKVASKRRLLFRDPNGGFGLFKLRRNTLKTVPYKVLKEKKEEERR